MARFFRFFVLSMIFNSTILLGQGVSISSQADHAPDAASILDLYTTVKGLLIPRLTSDQIQVLENPVDGLMVYNTSNGKIYIYIASNNSWSAVEFGTETIAPFTCGSPFTDFRDQIVYNTVLINDRCWFAENLNHGTYIPHATIQSNNQVVEKYCYNDNAQNCANYGGLYYWQEAMNYGSAEGVQGICPPGWHIPTDNEYYLMENYLDNTVNDPNVMGLRGTDCGGKLKETGTTYWQTPNTGATNSSGFTARGGGYEYYYSGYITIKQFNNLLETGRFWSSSHHWQDPFSYGPIYRYMQYNSSQSGRNFSDESFTSQSRVALSVRCIKNI